ncbi:MAG: hypothetical protein K9M54_01425 [Kiritimatiellales bacterium]|nr:hypothetical protein [Kiritimatiellales bacterium]MCF7863693.1 hypothetical protein [Kiritimatiellales bacterium]
MVDYKTLTLLVCMAAVSGFANDRVDPTDPSMAKKHIDPAELERQLADFIRNKPEKEQLEGYNECMTAISRSLETHKPMAPDVGRTTFGFLEIYTESLGKKEEFSKLILEWFDQYADIEPMLTEWIYRLKPVDEWFPLFNAKYQYLTNEQIRYRIRTYAFTETRALEDSQTNMEPENPTFTNLAVTISPAGAAGDFHYAVRIENFDNIYTYVFPQTSIETEWERSDSILLPRRSSYDPFYTPKREVVFLRPGETLVRTFNLKVAEKDTPYSHNTHTTPARNIIFVKERDERYCFLRNVCVAFSDETIGLRMNVMVPAFSEGEYAALKSNLENKYGPKSSRFRLLEQPVRSNSLKLSIESSVLDPR